MAAAAPTFAASPQPELQRNYLVTRSSCTGGNQLRVTTDNVNTFFRIINVRPNSTVTGITASVLVSVNNLTGWTSSNAAWSAPTRTGETFSDGTRTYYRYRSNYVGTVPAPDANGTITLPRIDFSLPCSSAVPSPVWVNGRGEATVNGTTLSNIGGYRSV
ncbi:hypothetical protein [Janibacter sp. GXQ6167]|uniref:hypothetical protein n=1 Tax=Janibacter sp. GXQ6167 TaxID=3240791 RepID=UPI003523978B